MCMCLCDFLCRIIFSGKIIVVRSACSKRSSYIPTASQIAAVMYLGAPKAAVSCRR